MNFHSWKCYHEACSSLGFRTFNVAMNFHSWKSYGNQRGFPWGPSSFNVAMNFHSWKSPERKHSWQNLVNLQCCHEFSFMEIGSVCHISPCGMVSFNVAMNFHSWKSPSLRSPSPPITHLQCCHEFSFMEMFRIAENSPVRIHPSMLPWIFIHGNFGILVLGSVASAAFNVAMNFHSWKSPSNQLLPLSRSILQCCHEFSFMEIGWWCPLCAWCYTSFNVAMNFHSWKCPERRSQRSAKAIPSMLPWIFIHGNTRLNSAVAVRSSTFNVAMNFHSWK